MASPRLWLSVLMSPNPSFAHLSRCRNVRRRAINTRHNGSRADSRHGQRRDHTYRGNFPGSGPDASRPMGPQTPKFHVAGPMFQGGPQVPERFVLHFVDQ